jgi:hypothetical protein
MELYPPERSTVNALFINEQASAGSKGEEDPDDSTRPWLCQKRQKSSSSFISNALVETASNPDGSDIGAGSGHDRKAVSTTSTPLHQASSSISSKSGPCSRTSSRTDDVVWTDMAAQHALAINRINQLKWKTGQHL